MIGSTWNSLFLTVAMAAGMFAQQAAHKFSAASEDKQVNSLAGLEEFCSSQAFYLAGHFQLPVAEPEVLRRLPPPSESAQALALAAEPSAAPAEPPTAAAEPQPEGPGVPPIQPAVPATEPVPAPEDVVPAAPQIASEAPPAAEAPTAATAEETPAAATVAEATPEEPAASVPQVASAESADESSKQPDSAEVLPLPTPEKEPRTSVGQFDASDDRPSSTAPLQTPTRAPLPPSLALPSQRTYSDWASADASRYVTPSDLVRERAVARGEQRRQRIETRKWLGISPLRPSVPASPYSAVEEPQQLILVVPHVSARVQP